MANSFSMTLSPAGHCRETGEARFCEPYVLLTSIDLRPARPDVEAFLYGPWRSVSSKAGANIIPLVWRESFWRLDMVATPITEPDDVIFLIALMEHLNGNPSAVRVLVKKAVIEALDTSAAMTGETRIAKLIHDVNRAVDLANGGPNVNSAIGLLLTPEDVTHLNRNGSSTLVRSFSGYGGLYCLSFELGKAESDLRNLVSQKDGAFACAAE